MSAKLPLAANGEPLDIRPCTICRLDDAHLSGYIPARLSSVYKRR